MLLSLFLGFLHLSLYPLTKKNELSKALFSRNSLKTHNKIYACLSAYIYYSLMGGYYKSVRNFRRCIFRLVESNFAIQQRV